MDARIRRRASATSTAIAVVLSLGLAVGDIERSAAATDPGTRAPAHGATKRAPRHPAKSVARPRPALHPAPGPLASPVPAPSLGLGPRRPLELTLSQTKIGSILDRYPAEPGKGAHSAFDDVTVMAPAELQPMRDPVHEVWGGIAAPVWAMLHPSEAWRIFLPVPPK